MEIVFTILASVLLITMLAGQFRVASRAIYLGKAGFGRFTYLRGETPRAFWLAVAAEWICFALLFVFGLVVTTKVLFG